MLLEDARPDLCSKMGDGMKSTNRKEGRNVKTGKEKRKKNV